MDEERAVLGELAEMWDQFVEDVAVKAKAHKADLRRLAQLNPDLADDVRRQVFAVDSAITNLAASNPFTDAA